VPADTPHHVRRAITPSPVAALDHVSRPPSSSSRSMPGRAGFAGATAAGQIPLNLVLGRLVERDVDRHRARRARAGTADDQLPARRARASAGAPRQPQCHRRLPGATIRPLTLSKPSALVLVRSGSDEFIQAGRSLPT
jgi:hypothetical protein